MALCMNSTDSRQNEACWQTNNSVTQAAIRIRFSKLMRPFVLLSDSTDSEEGRTGAAGEGWEGGEVALVVLVVLV